MQINKIHNLDCLEGIKLLEGESVNTIITSPPYNKKGLSGGTKKIGNQIWKKFNIDYSDYNDNLKEEDYQKWQLDILDESYRILKKDGSFFYNHKPRRFNNKCYLPTDWISKSKFNIYQVIIWNRKSSPNIRNEHFTPTTEYIYWLTKDKPKFYKSSVDKEYTGEVWNITPLKGSEHPAPFHPIIPELLIKLTTDPGDLVLDPFMGIGTVAEKCKELERNFIGFEIDKKYIDIYENKNDISSFQ